MNKFGLKEAGLSTNTHQIFLEFLYMICLAIYCKRITFGNVFFSPLSAVVSLPQIKYIAKCEITCQMKSTLNYKKSKIRQISYTLNIICYRTINK